MSGNYLASFTPSEVETISGLSTVMQRNWRRHGYLSSANSGHARFNPFDVARLMVMRMFSDRGVGPAETSRVAEICAAGIVYAALCERDAYGPNIDLETMKREHIDFQSVARNIVRDQFAPVVPARYLIWWADGKYKWDGSLDTAFFVFDSGDPAIQGPVMVLDLHSLGIEFLKKAKKPLTNLLDKE